MERVHRIPDTFGGTGMRWHWGYAVVTVVLLATEVLIALFVRDAIVRPYFGDVLAVVLVYTGLRSVTRLRVIPAALSALVIAFAIEFGQYFHVLDQVGLGDDRILRVVLGTGFDPVDLFCYILGAAAVVLIERLRS